jgi:hypothetical protein
LILSELDSYQLTDVLDEGADFLVGDQGKDGALHWGDQRGEHEISPLSFMSTNAEAVLKDTIDNSSNTYLID